MVKTQEEPVVGMIVW